MANVFVNVNGTWKAATPFINKNDEWKSLKAVWVKQNDIWTMSLPRDMNKSLSFSNDTSKSFSIPYIADWPISVQIEGINNTYDSGDYWEVNFATAAGYYSYTSAGRVLDVDGWKRWQVIGGRTGWYYATFQVTVPQESLGNYIWSHGMSGGSKTHLYYKIYRG